MPCALLPPPRTGRADFPHPALLKTLVAGFHTFLLLFGLLTQSRPQRGNSYSRSGTSCVQAVFLAFRLKHVFSKAPSLHRHYPASSLLWASPTPASTDVPLCLPVSPLSFWRVSQVPRLFFRCTPSPFTPESLTTACSRFFVISAGFATFGRLTALICVTRPIRVRLRYGLHLCRTRLRLDGLLRLALV